MRYGHAGYNAGWDLSPAGWVLMILFWVALATVIAVGVVMLARLLSRPAHPPIPPPSGPPPGPPPGLTPESSALRILDERFARGEIDVEEYRQRGDELRRPPPPDGPTQ